MGGQRLYVARTGRDERRELGGASRGNVSTGSVLIGGAVVAERQGLVVAQDVVSFQLSEIASR